MALKAALVNNPPNDEEGQLYAEIGRSKPAPQGICVVNGSGKVLDWSLMFDDDKSVLTFLDHCQKRFVRFPDAKQPIAAERFMRFPSMKLDDVADTRKALPNLDHHPKGKHCPGTPPLQPGTVVARLFGRALDKDGKPLTETLRQEHYVEDRFQISVGMQEQLAKALIDAGDKRFRLPEALAREIVSHAYLGQLDVNPAAAPGGKGNLTRNEWWAQKDAAGKGTVRLRVEGKSEAAGSAGDGDSGDGRQWTHEVKLSWEGWIEMEGVRITHVVLQARGNEKLKWGNRGMQDLVDVARLPAGHPIDMNCGVRYGVIGEPAPADQVSVDAPILPFAGPLGPVGDEPRRQLVDSLGPAFIIFYEKVQDELKLNAEQKEKVQERLAITIRDTQQFFEKINSAAAEKRAKEHAAYRQRSQEVLAAFLQGALNLEQLKRLGQLELQQQGLLAIMRSDIATDLNVTDEQRRQIQGVVESLESKVRSVLQASPPDAKHADLRAKVAKIRREHEPRLEAILNAEQQKRWKEMIGKTINLGD